MWVGAVLVEGDKDECGIWDNNVVFRIPLCKIRPRQASKQHNVFNSLETCLELTSSSSSSSSVCVSVPSLLPSMGMMPLLYVYL